MEKLNAIVWPATEKLVMEQVSKLHQQGRVKYLHPIDMGGQTFQTKGRIVNFCNA